MKTNATSLVVTGVGAAVSGLGATQISKKWGAGIFGFGLAHLVLGFLDMFRPSLNK